MFPRRYTQQVISDLDAPVAEAPCGKLRGTNTGEGFIFRGVPYAEAERFHMPHAVKPWDGIRDAVIYGPVCAEISTMIPKDGFTVPHFWYPQSEHCQYLNIWTPTLDRDAKRPVMVWIHGGGFEHGSSVEIFAYDGEALSQFGDVVVVSLNHRVHGLGYLDLSAYGPQYEHSGNLGMADLVEALRWIQQNIEAFGGDPGNVMLMGQSGGGGKISTLMQMPCADGLFHKICIESGISDQCGEESPAHAQAFAARVVSILGLTAETIGQIETVPFHRLAAALTQAANDHQKETGSRFRYGPVADGGYYLGHPARVGFRPAQRHIPLLIGNVLGEFENNVIDPYKYEDGHKNSWNEETLCKRLNRKFGALAPEIRAAFEQTYPDHNVADVLFTASSNRAGHVGYAKLRAAFGAPVYNWLLTLELPADGGSTPWHNAEEPFVFHQCEYLESTFIPEVTDRLQDQIAGAWVAFARTGDPNHNGLPHWSPLTADCVNTMIFDRQCCLRCNHDTELIALMERAKFHDTGKDGPLRGYGGGPRHDV